GPVHGFRAPLLPAEAAGPARVAHSLDDRDPAPDVDALRPHRHGAGVSRRDPLRQEDLRRPAAPPPLRDRQRFRYGARLALRVHAGHLRPAVLRPRQAADLARRRGLSRAAARVLARDAVELRRHLRAAAAARAAGGARAARLAAGPARAGAVLLSRARKPALPP